MGVAIAFVHVCVPETKGKTMDEIHGAAALSPLLAEEYFVRTD